MKKNFEKKTVEPYDQIILVPPGFSDLPTALQCSQWNEQMIQNGQDMIVESVIEKWNIKKKSQKKDEPYH